ncbi:MAG: hypothetical protein PHE27_07565 [Alphaproteobacteria bacterium]|nr:hypothetical protein [Alphaproteobacteria bacterium]
MSTPSQSENLFILTETNIAALVGQLKTLGIDRAHFTNGAYTAPQEVVVPTTLAGFQFIGDQDDTDTPFIIAVNSDKSMKAIMEEKIANGTATEAEAKAVEDQETRARKVAEPLALQNPNRKIVVVFYNEGTPNALYDGLCEAGFGMASLYKWGYGTDPRAGVIEGAENFKKTYGFPFPGDVRPLCDDLTRRGGQAGTVIVKNLRETKGPHGKPYITEKNECLIPLLHEGLLNYGKRGQGAPTPQMQGPHR